MSDLRESGRLAHTEEAGQGVVQAHDDRAQTSRGRCLMSSGSNRWTASQAKQGDAA